MSKATKSCLIIIIGTTSVTPELSEHAYQRTREQRTAFHYEICGDASWYRGRNLQAPRNGGLPAKEWLDDNMPRQRLYGAPYRCNCET